MATIKITMSLHGGWYGSVDVPADASLETQRAACLALKALLDDLRADLESKPRKQARPGRLNDDGRAVIEWLSKHPTATDKALAAAIKPTNKTLDWLDTNGFIRFDSETNRWVLLNVVPGTPNAT